MNRPIYAAVSVVRSHSIATVLNRKRHIIQIPGVQGRARTWRNASLQFGDHTCMDSGRNKKSVTIGARANTRHRKPAMNHSKRNQRKCSMLRRADRLARYSASKSPHISRHSIRGQKRCPITFLVARVHMNRYNIQTTVVRLSLCARICARFAPTIKWYNSV